MKILLWVLQVLLALHTAMGAVWKFTNSEQTVPSLQALPHAVWLGLGVLELLGAAALLLPAVVKPLRKAPPLAAGFVAGEMLLFTVVHFASGVAEHGEVAYWGVVAGFCAFLAYGRTKLQPL